MVKVGAIGFAIGILMVAGLALGGLTGFVVVVGSTTVNLDQQVTEDTLIPLSIPENILSLTLDGRYEGTGDVTIHLIGANNTYLVASHKSAVPAGNNTFVLSKGGTVVELAQSEISFKQAFVDACRDTCEEQMTGPFYLQVRVSDGTMDLTSLTYTAEEIIADPVEPDPEVEQEIVNIPVPVERVNPPAECSVDADCGSGLVCHVEYCISQTGHLNITDSSGRVVALFDKYGRILLAGDLYEETAENPPANSFEIIAGDTPVAWVTPAGDLHLGGELVEHVVSVPIEGQDNFIIRNESDYVAVIQGFSGDMYTVKDLIFGVLE